MTIKAVRFEFMPGGPTRSLVFAFYDPTPEAIHDFIEINPGIFWPDAEWRTKIIGSWHNERRYENWLWKQVKRGRKFYGWTLNVLLITGNRTDIAEVRP